MPQTLLSVNNYHYARGGADVVFLRHNRMFEAQGWSVVPFCMHHRKNRPSAWSSHFVEEIEIGADAETSRGRVRKGLKAVYSIEARNKVRRLVDATAPNLCHAHNVYHHISPSILEVIRGRGIPLVMTLHDLKIACPAYSMLTHDGVCERCRSGRLFHVLTNRCIKNSTVLSLLVMVESYLHRLLGSYVDNVDRFVVPSRFYLNKLVEWGFDAARFDYVPNFVDTAAYEPRFRPGRRFVYFGRLAPEKGLVTLIEAAATARVGLDIVGAGTLEASLRRIAARRDADVRFLGFLSGGALHEAVSAARAVVVPSEWYENAPLSVLEACALGKPVIVAAIGGLPELVVDGESGWIFDSGSVDALAGCLAQVASRADRSVAAAGTAAHDYVSAEFSPRRYIDALRPIYRRLGVTWH